MSEHFDAWRIPVLADAGARLVAFPQWPDRPTFHECKKCGGGFAYLCKDVNRNATYSVWLVCTTCGRKNGPVPHAKVNPELGGVELLPILNDRRCDECAGFGCARCTVGRACVIRNCPDPYRHLELHHIWPHAWRDRAESWQDWPTIDLCRRHHVEYHRGCTPELVLMEYAA